MSGVDWRTRRREQTRQEILDAAWAVARDHGFAGLTMRDLRARVGMPAQFRYSYLRPSAQGNLEVLARYCVMVADHSLPRDPRSLLRRTAEVHLRFYAEDRSVSSCCTSEAGSDPRLTPMITGSARSRPNMAASCTEPVIME
jgi:Bacterial regulatory proteins, tetR family